MIELLLSADRLLAAGELDRAERIYRQVAEADPRNAIAVVGLARVAEARGDVGQALELVGDALAIDPDDLAAHRLAGVLATAAIPPAPDEPAAPAVPPTPKRPAPRPSILARLRAFLRLGG